MENMAEEELLPQEKVEVVQVPVPTPTPDSARVPAPAPDSAPVSASTPAPASAPTPASAPVPAPALAQASALSPSLASAPDEAESSKCREAQIFLPQEEQESAPCWGVGEALLHWNGFYGEKAVLAKWGEERGTRIAVKTGTGWGTASPQTSGISQGMICGGQWCCRWKEIMGSWTSSLKEVFFWYRN